MTIEEKAKRYDKALEMARDSFTYPDYPGFIRADVVFPELKESEDEKVRKALIELVKFSKKSCFEILKDMPFNVVSMDEILAWLEKQNTKFTSINENVIEAADEWYKTAELKSSWWDNGIPYLCAEYHEAFKAGAEWLKKVLKDKVNNYGKNKRDRY